MKKLLSVLLILSLSLGLLAGCGKKETEAEAPQSQEAYAAAFRELSFPEDVYPSAWAVTEAGVYVACYEKLAEGAVPEGKTLDYEGQYDTYGYRLYLVDEAGEKRALDYESLPAPEDTQGRKNYSASTGLARLLPLPDGTLLALEQHYASWYTGTDDQRPENADDYYNFVAAEERYTLRLLDGEGRELQSHPLEWEGNGEGAYLNTWNAAADAQGRLYCSGDQCVYVFNPDGTLLTQIPTEDWINSLLPLQDGRMVAESYGRGGMALQVVDPESGSLAERYALDQYPENLYPGAGDYDLLYTSGTGLYGYRLEEQGSEKILDLLDCDMTGTELQALRMAADGSMRGVWWDRSEADSSPELVTLRKEPRAGSGEKTVLTLGTLYGGEVSRAVLKFNRQSDTTRIVLRDYSDYLQGAEDYEQGLTKLVTEMLSGNMPDLLALDSLPYEQLAAKGLLENLYPYLDADPELSREDFFENVLAAAEVGNGLYQAFPGFSIITLMGPSAIVGDTPGWTYEDFEAAMAQMPEGCTPLGPYVDRENMLEMGLFLEMNSFVDWAAGKCDFESENFLRLLAFCKSFPQDASYEGDGAENNKTRIAEGRQLLMQTGIYSMDEVVYNDQYFGGDSTYIGFPTEQGTGNILYLSEGYAMSSSCADKEAAWEFLRTFFTEDYQSSDGVYSLPLNRAAFQKKLDKAMEQEYEMDEEGHYLLDANGERIPVSKGGMGVSMGDDGIMEFELYAMTPAQADKLMQAIQSATKTVDMNTNIYNIVKEEAAAYFADQKTAEEVARLIQSKASLYISEQA